MNRDELKWYATIWNDNVTQIVESYGPYDTEATAKRVATRLHKSHNALTGYEARVGSKVVKGEGDVWPDITSNYPDR